MDKSWTEIIEKLFDAFKVLSTITLVAVFFWWATVAFLRFRSEPITTKSFSTYGDNGKGKGRLRATIFKSADTAHLIASPKYHNNIRCTGSTANL